MTDFLEFDEYIRQGEPNQQKRAAIWRTAIGLQAVDGLQTSDYLKETAKKHIEGEIDIDEARQLIKTYYQSKATREVINDDQCEADKVSANITKILSYTTITEFIDAVNKTIQELTVVRHNYNRTVELL